MKAINRADRKPAMRFENFSFGSVLIDGHKYTHDIVLDRGEIRRRKKKPSKKFRQEFGHTPLSVEDDIPWNCGQLVSGTGAYGKMPIMQEVRDKAERNKIKLFVLPTAEAIEISNRKLDGTNAILDVTC